MREPLIFQHSRPGRSAEAQYPLAPATATRWGAERGVGAVVPVMWFLVCRRPAGAAGAARVQRLVDSSGG